MEAPCLPGKIRDLMAVGQPILGLVPGGSEAGKLIQRAGCGIVIDPNNVDEIPKAILKLKDQADLGRRMGKRGFRFAHEKMKLENGARAYAKIPESRLR